MITENLLTEEIYSKIDEILGWCDKSKVQSFVERYLAIQPRVCVEIGVYHGRSAITQMLLLKNQGEGKLYAIDAWENAVCVVCEKNPVNINWWSKEPLEAAYKAFLDHVTRLNLQPFCEVIRKPSIEAAKEMTIPLIDFLHIDGNHSEDKSIQDVLAWVPRLRKGGCLIFDDIDWETTRKAQELIETTSRVFKKTEKYGVYMKL